MSPTAPPAAASGEHPLEWFARPASRAWTTDSPGAAVQRFHRALPGYAPTALTELPALAAELGVARLFVKDESSRFGLPAFKALGASWAVARVIAERAELPGELGSWTLKDLRAGAASHPLRLVTATDGNHGRALARMARLVGVPALVVVPGVVAPAARDLIAAEGAEVVVLAADYDAAVAEAARLADLDEDAVLVQDTAWPGYETVPGWIVEGYTTLTAEVDEQLAAAGIGGADLVVVPVGVGSLAQAVVTHYRRPGRSTADGSTAVLSVEPDTAACVLTSLREGRAASVSTAATVMAGLNCPTPSSLAWPVLSAGLDAATVVTDDDARREATVLASAGISSGPCGAASLAAARAVLTGGGAQQRRVQLGLPGTGGRDAVVVLLSTEGTNSGSSDPAVAPSVVADAQPLLRINGQRLWNSLTELAHIGAYTDAATGLVGVNRQSLTDDDAEGRRLLVRWMTEAGLAVGVDAMGTIYGRREGTRPDLAPVMAASHIDTVATAGAFDGCLGVLGALEVVRTLDEQHLSTERPLVIAAFTEEEGVRFGTDMLGSAVAAGRIPLAQAHDLRDAAGLRFGDELARIGFHGDADPTALRDAPPHAYVECHIEQGPVLAEGGFTVGVVTGVQAISWQRVTLHGRAAHAGTTPTELRIDPALAAAQLIVQLRAMVDSGRYGRLRATTGHIATHPGVPSVVPDRVELTVDLRNPDDDAMARAEADLAAFLDQLPAGQPGLRVEVARMAKTRHVPFDEGVQKAVSQAATDLGHEHLFLMSGAGHDAQEVAAVAPVAMVFVRGEFEGISHNPREYSTPEACAAGVDVLATTLLRLSRA